MGSGSRNATPPQRRPDIADSIANVRRWSPALFSEPTSVQAFVALEMPVLYMLGESSPESAHAVARVLLPVLPRAQAVGFPGLGHMAPITHPEAINAAVAKFLSEAQPGPVLYSNFPRVIGAGRLLPLQERPRRSVGAGSPEPAARTPADTIRSSPNPSPESCR